MAGPCSLPFDSLFLALSPSRGRGKRQDSRDLHSPEDKARWWLILLMPMLLVGLTIMPYGGISLAQDDAFSAAYLQNPANIALGKAVWHKRCQLCHGKLAYPGTAPKLQAWRYKPAFVYDRVTNGFRGMPALKQEFSEQERRAIVAYVMSPVFSR